MSTSVLVKDNDSQNQETLAQSVTRLKYCKNVKFYFSNFQGRPYASGPKSGRSERDFQDFFETPKLRDSETMRFRDYEILKLQDYKTSRLPLPEYETPKL